MADRKAQFGAALRVKALLDGESALMDRITFLRSELAQNLDTLPESSELKKQVAALDAKIDIVRKLIVATTEGGAITGEERLREHTDQLYGAILGYEGKPADYQIANIMALESELKEVSDQFSLLLSDDLKALNKLLSGAGKKSVAVPPQIIAWSDSDLTSANAQMPVNLLLLR